MMQSEREDHGGEIEEVRQNQRLKPPRGDQQQQPLPPQPQKCPRCESSNTKFCYYNNYRLSQPRYFCKTCRRYWTQGGTQRNVPVGGSRKGKRAKTTSSSGENSSSQPNQPHPRQNFAAPQTIVTSTNSDITISTSPAVMNKESGMPSMGSFNSGGGFLSSLAAIQSLQPPQPFNQPVNLGGRDLVGSSNLGLLQGFNVNLNMPCFGSKQQINQQRQFYQMGAADRGESNLGLTYTSDQQESLITQSGRAAASSSSPRNWHQNFINNTNPNVSGTTMRSTVVTSAGGNSSSTITTTPGSSSTSLNPNQWPPHLRRYGAAP